MERLHKTTTLPALQGVLFTDPSYRPGTWCRYESNAHLKGWAMDYYGEDRVDDGYRFTAFALVLANPDYAEYIKPSADLMSFTHPMSLSLSETLVGMDTACIYLGPQTALDADDWQPGCALRTGTDGEFGTVYELKEKDEVVAVVLFGFIDSDFGTKESVWEYLKGTFGIRGL